MRDGMNEVQGKSQVEHGLSKTLPILKVSDKSTLPAPSIDEGAQESDQCIDL